MTGQIGAVGASSRVWTVPNVLSAARLALVPVFFLLLVNEEYVWAVAALIISSLSDYFDGWIARRFGQVTRLGQLLDPAADRLYVLAALIGLAIVGVLPWWLSAIIIGRDVVLAVVGIVLASHGYGPLPVHHLGKVATFALFYALPVIVLGRAFPLIAPFSDPIGYAAACWGAFLYWWAGAIYVGQTASLVRASASSKADGGVERSATLDGQGRSA